MWSGPIHESEFVAKVLEHVDSDADHYGTSVRMKGMLTVAKEVGSYPFRHTQSIHFINRSCTRRSSSRRAKWLASSTANAHLWTTSRMLPRFFADGRPMTLILTRRSALLNAGHEVSRSHASAGSLKTTASRADVHDIFRSWVKKHPVRMDKLSETSPARVLLAKEPQYADSLR